MMYKLFWLYKALVTVLGSLFGTLYLKMWGCRLNGMVKCVGIPRVEKEPGGRIELGKRVTLRSARCSNVAGVFRPVSLCAIGQGQITIGDGSGVSGAVIVSEECVSIGEHVLIGAHTTILDTDFHPLDAKARRTPHAHGKTAPVTIEDDVFIGMNCTILKGVVIGRGAVVAANSVVTRSVAPETLVGGNPAKMIRAL